MNIWIYEYMDNIWMINMDFTMIILNDVDIDDDR